MKEKMTEVPPIRKRPLRFLRDGLRGSGRGGIRPGAGRKPKFENRDVIQVYIERDQKELLQIIAEYLSDQGGSVSTSSILQRLARAYIDSRNTPEFRRWAMASSKVARQFPGGHRLIKEQEDESELKRRGGE